MLRWRLLVSSVNFKIVKSFIRSFLFSFCFFAQVKVHAWDVDLSRRQPEPTQVESAQPASPRPVAASKKIEKSTDAEIVEALKNVINPTEISKEIVILNTETGFIPDVIRVKKDEVYKIHIVNLNMKEKNVSFLMDSFTQSHNTIFGNLRTFTIEPKVEGVFSYQCPETGLQGKLVVVPTASGSRKTASEQ